MAGNGKRKLCLVIPSLQAGGMERVMSELAWYFSSRQDMEIHLVLYGMTREVFFTVPESVNLYRPSFRFNNRLRFVYTLKTLAYLRKTVKDIDPESILSFGELWNSFVLLALYGLRIPVYISDRCSPERAYNSVHTFLRKWLYPRAAGIIAQTRKAREISHTQFRNQNIRVIGNPIRPMKPGLESDKERMILTIGRLIASKHHDKLIELFLDIRIPGWKLVIVGYDHLKQNNFERLQEIIDRNQAGNKVFLEGKQKHVEGYYSRSRIFAFTSSSEGFPNAIGEAMSAGIPVVAFDCVAGPSDLIRDGQSGFLIPLFDYESFRAKLERLMSEDNLREKLGNQARQDMKKFSITQIGEEYLNFIFGNRP